MTDADVDAPHIRAPILAFLTGLNDLISAGHVYIAGRRSAR
jgi:DNA gyrase/topoisomerase IV subunit B